MQLSGNQLQLGKPRPLSYVCACAVLKNGKKLKDDQDEQPARFLLYIPSLWQLPPLLLLLLLLRRSQRSN
jgi:hypothetical protein